MVGDSVSEKGSVVDEEGKVVCGQPTGRSKESELRPITTIEMETADSAQTSLRDELLLNEHDSSVVIKTHTQAFFVFFDAAPPPSTLLRWLSMYVYMTYEPYG
jgi:hypothetical protein